MGYLDLMDPASKDFEEILNSMFIETIEQEVENSINKTICPPIKLSALILYF